MYNLIKRAQKLKHVLFLCFMTTFNIFGFKKEANDPSMHVWFIHSSIKDFTKIQCKKE